MKHNAKSHISNIRRHLINLSRVELLNVLQNSQIVVLHEVDCHTLPAETTTTTYPVDVQLTVFRQVVVDD